MASFIEERQDEHGVEPVDPEKANGELETNKL